MTFAPTFDLTDGQVSPQERIRALMLKLLQRRKSISPNPADGFLTTGTHADSAAEGDGGSTTTAPGATSQQN